MVTLWYFLLHRNAFWIGLAACIFVCVGVLLKQQMDRFKKMRRPVGTAVIVSVLTMLSTGLYLWTTDVGELVGLSFVGAFVAACFVVLVKDLPEVEVWVLNALLLATVVIFAVGIGTALSYVAEYYWAG